MLKYTSYIYKNVKIQQYKIKYPVPGTTPYKLKHKINKYGGTKTCLYSVDDTIYWYYVDIYVCMYDMIRGDSSWTPERNKQTKGGENAKGTRWDNHTTSVVSESHLQSSRCRMI